MQTPSFPETVLPNMHIDFVELMLLISDEIEFCRNIDISNVLLYDLIH